MSFENSSALTVVFGGWPSFHDAEVLRLHLDRPGSEGPILEIAIHVFEMTKDVDSKGYSVLRRHTEVTLRFTRVRSLRVESFNGQNVLSSLDVAQVDPGKSEGRRLRVRMPSSYGMEAEFECERAVVADVRAFEPAL